MNTGIFYIIFFVIVILFSLYILGFFNNSKKNISVSENKTSSSFSNEKNVSVSNNKTSGNKFLKDFGIGLGIGLVLLLFVGLVLNNNDNTSSNFNTEPDTNNIKTFEREKLIHRCGREWDGERDETYGVFGDYCCVRCYADFYPN